MTLSNFNTSNFSALKPFFKTKLVSHNIKVCSYYNFLNHIYVYSESNGGGHVKQSVS